jgi:hypothetical protein
MKLYSARFQKNFKLINIINVANVNKLNDAVFYCQDIENDTKQ